MSAEQSDLAILSSVSPLFIPFEELRAEIHKNYEPVIEAIYFPSVKFSEVIGCSMPEAVQFINIFQAFFLCLGLSLISNPFARKLYSSTCGFYLGLYNYGLGYVFVIFSFTAVYLSIAALPRNLAFYVGNAVLFTTTGYLLYLDFLTNLQFTMNAFIIIV